MWIKRKEYENLKDAKEVCKILRERNGWLNEMINLLERQKENLRNASRCTVESNAPFPISFDEKCKGCQYCEPILTNQRAYRNGNRELVAESSKIACKNASICTYLKGKE